MRTHNYLLISLLVVILALTFPLISLQAGAEELAEYDDTYVIAEGSWPGIQVKNEVIRQVLGTLGYDFETEFLGQPMIYEGMSQGEIDFYLGSWMPEEAGMREGHEEGYEVISTQLDDAVYMSAVPEYVYEAGVQCHSDIAEHAEKFDHTLHAGAHGEGADEILTRAVEEDIYGLEGWEIVNADWPATVAEAEQAIEDEEWIIFPGWQPHWMNVLLDVEYLDDPKNIWGEDSSVIENLVHPDLQERAPQLYQILENFQIESDHQSRWVFEYDQEDREMEKIAEEWIEDNLDTVADWLEGAYAENGRQAIEVIEENF
ncbi:glycine betaine ABC transporter substrate-binding protein [Halarsenatibacter silvermanii]|uniref:Glycine betaine/proline transport system substrate-binding protein n=1 Tax=Halarsenatibacter silvermanii TaxID=321763 RepID=A0A1G9MWM8_9FIRM|nr:glycine betaine ABC transporter substrate-binding protein [Halarsenatibacter silvermanii]SDL78421.1 glycine betaine/proline transport system substrate-binding protein [Halarsenatibacter silvermanii]